MATKTFKIGLSNTDKQNMAQDVYERILALTFQEYDSAEEYNVGDFVVYNDQLYKCIGATTGAWDSTKWQLATLNDLVTDIEGAVAFVNDKANVDGNYPTMTVGAAENLTPYSEESGTDQEEPFNFQATATANGSNPLFSASGLALLKEKRGNTVVVNQLVPTASMHVTFTLTEDKESVGWGDTITNLSQVLSRIGHKVLAYIKTTDGTKVSISWGANGHNFVDGIQTVSGQTEQFGVYDLSSNIIGTNGEIAWRYFAGATAGTYEADIFLVDLTQWFNGDISQDLLDHPNHFFRYYQGSLSQNTGTLVNADGRYIKTFGMNQWDEETVVDTYLYSKNFIKVIPNAEYYFAYKGSNAQVTTFYLLQYDKYKNLLEGYPATGDSIGGINKVVKLEPECCYIKFRMQSYYGTTYNNDVSINLYYEDEPRCLTYEPHEELSNVDTGIEILRSAGNVVDIKLPSGEIKRNIGSVDLGSLSWTYNSQLGVFTANLNDAKQSASDSVSFNGICSKYSVKALTSTVSPKISGLCPTVNALFVLDTSYGTDAAAFKTAMSGVYLFYELAEPTTEQGTAFSENVLIDDFGTMDFGGTNGVPQGNKIFYAIDYKSFIDTTYNYTDGDPSNLALNSELNAKFESYLKSLTGYNASETQVLKNVEGTLTWVTEGE